MSDINYSKQPIYQENHQDTRQYEPYYPPPVHTQGLERQPVNGFNYQAQGGEDQVSVTPSSLRDYSYYEAEKSGNLEYEPVGSTEVPEPPRSNHQEYTHYNDAGLQSQTNYDSSVDNYGRIQNTRPEYHQSSVVGYNQNAQPVYVSQREKQIDYELQQPATEIPLEVMNYLND